LVPVVATMLFLAFRLETLSLSALAVTLGVQALFMGSVMGVVQVTVQNAAGIAMLGAAAGSVQFARAVGAAFGTALVASLLFSVLVSRDPEIANYFGMLIQRGPIALAALAPDRQEIVREALGLSFRYVFLLIAFYAMIALCLVVSIPTKRLP